MPTFKSRDRRCDAPSSTGHPRVPTLDALHSQRLKDIANDEEVRGASLKTEKAQLQRELACSSTAFERRLEAQDRLAVVREELRVIGRARRDYLLSNADRVFGYFEQKKSLDRGNSQATVLDDFFGLSKSAPVAGSRQQPNTNGYFRDMDDSYLDLRDFSINTDRCTSCGEGEMIAVEADGLMVCTSCSANRPYLVENDKPSYKEPPKEVCFYAYKRINHFREILAQFQAKESTQIPAEVLSAIKQQIRKERITLGQVTNKKAKDILKKLGYNKYYEHIPFIKDKLGIKPPIMCSELEDTLCRLFMEIQAPYAKFCPEDRVNFLNYYYTVYKLCELLDQVQFLPFFPMLKDREKRIEQDEIWKKICGELDWEFIPTV